MSVIKFKIIFLIFLPFCCFSQERTITVILDSIYQSKHNTDFNIDYSYGSLYGELLTKKSFNNNVNPISENIMSFNGQISINSDSTIIFIPFDDKNGLIKISNLSSLKNNDTLRINKIKVFKSNIVDTSFTVIKYFKTNNDSVSEKAYRIKKIKKIEKNKTKCNKFPKELSYCINGKIYKVDVKKINLSSNEIKTFNGQKPVNSRDPKIVFYGRTEKTNWINEITINLNHN